MQYSTITILLLFNEEDRKVKKYFAPEIEIKKLDSKDIITTSPGTETTPKDEVDGIWDLDLS